LYLLAREIMLLLANFSLFKGLWREANPRVFLSIFGTPPTANFTPHNATATRLGAATA